jgi:hypothetical protein
VSTTRYSVVIRGEVDAATLERVGDPEVRTRADGTELVYDVIDQSQLVGMLSGLSAAGVEVIRATPVDS